jgi:hypothetical protein
MHDLVFRLLYALTFSGGKKQVELKRSIAPDTLAPLRAAFSVHTLREDAALAESALRLVSSLCMGCPANQILFSDGARAGTAETRQSMPGLVLGAMRTHRFAENVQEWGCTALYNLSVNRDCQNAILQGLGDACF